MKITPIRANLAQNQKQKNSNNYLSNSIIINSKNRDTISFGYTQSEVERRVLEKKKSYTGWDWFWEENEVREKIIFELEKEDSQREIDLAISKESEKWADQRLKDMEQSQKEQEALREKLQASYNETTAAKDETIIQQGKAIEASEQLAQEKQTRIEEFQNLLNTQKEEQKKAAAESKILQEKLEKALAENNKKAQKDLEEALRKNNEMHAATMKDIIDKLKKTSNSVSIIDKMNTDNIEGFNKIAGYEVEKQLLKDIVGTPIALEKDKKPAKVPNGVFFFGPKGCGKTTFADAFANQLGCKLVKMQFASSFAVNKEKASELATLNYNKILNAAEASKKHFEETGQRTILLMDEFDSVAPKGSEIIGPLKSFMDDNSKEFHCTVFATANYPENIDDILLRDGRFDIKAGLSYANKPNAVSILKHYLNGIADESVNFDKLADEIVKGQPEAAFSNSRIKSAIQGFLKTHKDLMQINHTQVLQAIQDRGPDIQKEAIEIFKKQLEYIKTI